jgi:pyruvate dehydrogenase E1 component beta subunit
MDFVTLAANQLINMAAKMHYMTNGHYNVPLVVRAMIGRSWGQGAQHSQSLYSMFAHIPGLKVIAPSNAHDAKAGIIAAIRENNPVLFVEHRLLYSTKSFVPNEIEPLKIGKARVLKKGDVCTLVSLSHMVVESMRAAQILEKIGIDVEVIDLISIKPLDIATIYNSAKKTGHLIVVDNAWQTFGLASEIITQVLLCAQKDGVNIKYSRDGFAETPCPTTKSLEDLFYPSQVTISEKILELIGKSVERDKLLSLQVNSKELEVFKGPF